MATPPDSVGTMIVERQSIVDAPAERVWARVVTPEGINDELRPWMTMSMPRGAEESLTVDDRPGRHTGRPLLDAAVRRAAVRLRPSDDRRTGAGSRLSRRVDDAHHAQLAPRAHRSNPNGDAKTVVRDRLTFELRRPLRSLTPVGRGRASARCSGTGTDGCSGTSAGTDSAVARIGSLIGCRGARYRVSTATHSTWWVSGNESNTRRSSRRCSRARGTARRRGRMTLPHNRCGSPAAPRRRPAGR